MFFCFGEGLCERLFNGFIDGSLDKAATSLFLCIDDKRDGSVHIVYGAAKRRSLDASLV
jgi:hypothetical protein